MYKFKLYIVGAAAIPNELYEKLDIFFKKRLNGDCFIQKIDLFKDPESAESDKIFATPTLMKCHPEPVKKIIGDFSNLERVYNQLME